MVFPLKMAWLNKNPFFNFYNASLSFSHKQPKIDRQSSSYKRRKRFTMLCYRKKFGSCFCPYLKARFGPKTSLTKALNSFARSRNQLQINV